MKATELEFLEWFYFNCDFGPSDSDVKYFMKEDFIKETGKELPDCYPLEEDD